MQYLNFQSRHNLVFPFVEVMREVKHKYLIKKSNELLIGSGGSLSFSCDCELRNTRGQWKMFNN